ncbi:MAG: glycosyltransferase family 4 protein, partial [Acidimicrobiales bacterium]
MRIAFIPLSYLPNVGGAEFVLHNSLIEHRRAGHKVAVFPNLGSVAVVTHLPYRCVPVWRRAWSNTIAAGEGPGHRALPRRWLRWRLRAIQRWFKADVWHIHSVYPVSWAVIDVLRDELKVPVVITSHGGDVANYAELLGAEPDHQFEARVRATLAAADELIAVGPNVVKSYLEAGAPGDRIWVIPHGWHPQRVEQAERNLSTTKAALSLTGRLVALTVAADRPEKRLDDVLEASLLLDSDSSWSWIIATSSNRLSTEVNQSGLSDRVVVREEPPFSRTDFGHGLPRQEILDLYAVADVMVLPSLFEASPTVIHEAF